MKALLSLSRVARTTLRGLTKEAPANYRLAASIAESQPYFGLLVDIDGVLVRGKTPIPAARKAFKKLVNVKGEFLMPVVFVTNSGNCVRQVKADQLTRVLGVPISQDQVLMSHSPLRMFKRYHDKCVLVSGQGPVMEIAKSIGFTKIITIEMLREAFPLLDTMDHDRKPALSPSLPVKLPNIEAIILLCEPIQWETHLQLIIDVLLTAGNPENIPQKLQYPHIPVVACNTDLLWVAESKSPRFGHGIFVLCLENIYKKITGKDLKYELLVGKPNEITYHYAECLIRAQAAGRGWRKPIHTLYAIGDNPMTDIYGANLYNRYLEEASSRKGSWLQAKAAAGKQTATVSQDEAVDVIASELTPGSATCCKSVLVCTGVYSPSKGALVSPEELTTGAVFHGHRDFRFDADLSDPDYIVPDIDSAVELIYELERYVPK
ncbi:haloacid dehalogenase-like hydrolase domain-containing 5 [Chiloscyllium plagiosum]|uniref:haloacid dehalogenase-like hydrolase domain-containing 5 n=1 Tax=Chiloscyllium plagiosum TaxID=36176 RepID=UPI001CB881BE|nr:haloacid dehalogenase-like hydrolase domain-containing 5 [Chiloscyllium plagiosum]